MEKPSLDNKVFTDNPLLDEIVYNARQLVTRTVLKDWDRANNNETVDSIKNGDTLIAIRKGLVKFDYFHYTEEFLKEVPGISASDAHRYGKDNSLIPYNLHNIILSLACKEFLDKYEEKNNYYRMLHGEPNIDPEKNFEGIWVDVNTISGNRSLSTVSPVYKNTPGTNFKLIHKIDIGFIEALYDNGTIDSIITNKDRLNQWGLNVRDVEYLYHLGSRSIDYYEARSGERFSLLYCPDSDVTELKKRYKDLLEANRLYLLYTSYSEAYKMQSDYYDNFMMVYLVIQTVIDMIVELPEYIIRRDVFDARTCQYIFESNGVRYYKDIPLKYQIALVKNLNKLIKFKSSDKCIIDIASVFGIKNINIFKYYILKDRKIDNPNDMKYLNYEKSYKDTLGIVHKENDNVQNYDLRFVKVPLLGKYDDYIRTDTNILTYDDVTHGDAYWDGDKDHNVVLSDIKNMDFTLLRSKYYSVEALIDLTKRNFALVYFTNILLYNKIDKSKLLVNLPNISTKKKFELVDVIITLYSLSYLYWGAEDTILDSRHKVAEILGFNPEADFAVISQYLREHYDTSMQEMGVDKFIIPPGDKILSFNQLEDIYMTNKDVFDHVKKVLINPPDKRTYDAYMYIYKSLFIMKCNMDYYKLPDGNMAPTYKEFLRYKDSLLYEFINNFGNISNAEARRNACVNAIQIITTYLKDYVRRDLVNLDDVFSGLPSISLDFIKHYVEEVIDFFKSFKIFTHDSSLTYVFSDKFENYVLLIDTILLWYTFEKSDVVHIKDWIKNNHVEMTHKDKAKFIDKVWLRIDTWIKKNWEDYYNSDNYAEKAKTIKEMVDIYSHFYTNDTSLEERFTLDKITSLLVDVLYHEKDFIKESIKVTQTHDFIEYINETILDVMNYYAHYHSRDRYKMKDNFSYGTSFEMRTYEKLVEYMKHLSIKMNLKDDDYFMNDKYYLIRTHTK